MANSKKIKRDTSAATVTKADGPATIEPMATGKPWEHAKGGAGSEADPQAMRFVESLSYDRRLYKHDIAGSLAHAKMLCKVGLISKAELKAITRGLKDIEAEIADCNEHDGSGWPGWVQAYEDVHMCIEKALINKIGMSVGGKLHTGRSRNDQVALDLKLWIIASVCQLHGRFEKVGEALVQLAEKQGDVVMPSYTHLQRAQPIVLGGELAAWYTALMRAQSRFWQLLVVDDANPLGSGAIAGSSLPLDRKMTAKLTAPANVVGVFGEPGDSSIDATASRDAACDFLYALAMTSMTLSRWAEQWILYASTEFGFIKLDERYTTGSSMMPQKRNPDMLELIRGRCGNVYGHLLAMLTILKGLPIGYNRDLQEDKRQVFAAYDMVSDCLDIAAGIIATTTFNQKHIEAGLERGFLDATSLADYLVTRGVPFRVGHQIVGALVRTCEKRGLYQLEQLKLDDFNRACGEAKQPGVVQKDVYDWLGPSNVVKRYRTHGNAGASGWREAMGMKVRK